VKILITGATGFLGSALVERLLSRGEKDLRCLVRTGSNRSRLDAIAATHPEAAVEQFVGSLASKEAAAAAIEGVGVVYHLAASLGGAPADMFLNTVVTSKYLLDAVGDRISRAPAGGRIKIVLVSSFGVYGVADRPRGTLVDESTPFEAHPDRRDVYSQAKLRQEQLFHEYQKRLGFPLVVLRPGVIYGRDGSRMSARVGLDMAGVFLHLGGDNLLPLTYVENCAEAIAVAGQSDAANGQAYNVVDDDLVTAGEYLRRYRREVKPLRTVPVPYAALSLGSRLVVRYHRWSKGQLPAIFTPYKVSTSWKGNTFSNAKLKGLGWKPLVSTEEGLRLSFDHYRVHPK
jgi:nucleoside-diphosphate-sugar epimerase